VAQLHWGNWWVFYLGVLERGYNGFGVTLITHIHMSSLRITGIVPPIRHMPSWPECGQLNLYVL